GQEETWSFKISDEDGNVHDAEILASMYDASLDQFKTAQWNTSHGFYKRSTSYPSLNLFNVGQIKHLSNRFPYHPGYRELRRLFDRLDAFGFYFGQPNAYQYRLYLSRKKAGKLSTGLPGNTRGRVTDERGLPLPGVNVIIRGSYEGTQTNFDGEFALDTKPEDVLTFSYIGFKTLDILSGKDKDLYIVLEEDTQVLEEVVA